NFGGTMDDAAAVAVEPNNGRIDVAGSTNRAGSFDFAIARYNGDGSFDSTFDYDGKATTSLTGGDDRGRGIVLQSDGKIVVAGTADSGTSSADFALVRYNADGTLDTTFSGDGKVTTDFGGADEAWGIALQQ